MRKIILILQIALRLLLIFLLFFVWIRFFVKSLLYSVLISIACTIFVELILKIFAAKINKQKQLKIKEKEECENMFLSLCVNKDALDFFYNLALIRHTAIKKRKYIIINHKDYNVILYPFLKFSQITKDDLTEILKEIKNQKFKKLVIVCGDATKETILFVKNFDFEITILDKFETYSKIYKEYDFFPKITTTYKPNKKNTMKELLAYSFNKTKAKSYVFSALILFLSSMFVRINLYYSIMISILLIFAIISFFNPFYKTQKFEL